MKPIILNMREMKDSTEVYNKEPKSIVMYCLYMIIALIVVLIVGACFLKVDDVIKGDGVLRDSSEVLDITNNSVEDCRRIKTDVLSRASDTYGFGNRKIRTTSLGCDNVMDSCKFYVELYISSYDIGEVQEGQKVKFEVSSYPASKYGYCEGHVCDISKDAVVDERSGNLYYVVKVKSDSILNNKNGKKITLRNGMPCKGNICIGRKRLCNYILEKM